MAKGNLLLTAVVSAGVSAATAVVVTKLMKEERKPSPIILTGSLGDALNSLAAMFDTHGRECDECDDCECDCSNCECADECTCEGECDKQAAPEEAFEPREEE